LSPVATPAATSQSLAATPDARESALLAEYAEVATRLQYLPYSDSGRSIEPILTRQSLFPRVKYIAAKQPIASINVTSDEGKAEQVSSPFVIFERAAIDVFPTPTDQP
jgi:hypothetical protein